MDGLILLLILIPIVFLLLLISILNRSGEQKRLLESLYDKIKELSKEVAGLNKEIQQQKETGIPKPIIAEEKPVAPAVKPIPPVEEKKKEFTAKPFTPASVYRESSQKREPETVRQVITPVASSPTGKAGKKNTDIEKFIGENIANKIGIAVLVLGIAFFVKYAIDKNWIREAGRVIVGLISGGILIGLAHAIRNSYRSFSSVLVGGGLSVFYFTIAFAFHQYHLIGQTAAFVIMVIISGLGVILSLFYNRQELAILATIGGFVTPFLVNTGNENYIALFTYLCILNSGLMVLAWFKRWPSINTIALFFTTIIYSGWLFKRTIFEEPLAFPYKDAFLFATLFYILFVVMNIINCVRLKNKFSAFDFIILFSTNFLYYAAGILILSFAPGDNKGLFTALLGIVNLILTAIFYRKKDMDRNFVFLLMGLSLTFLTLSAAIQFKGNHIVLFWAAEMVVLYWLYQRSQIILLKWSSVVVGIAMLVSLIINWSGVYFSDFEIIPVITNKGFVTTVAAAVSLFLYYLLLKKEKDDFVNELPGNSVRKLVLILVIGLAWLSGILEIYYQFNTRYPEVSVYVVYLQVYTFAFSILLLRIFKTDPQQPVLKFFFTGACFVFYLLNLRATAEISLSLLTDNRGALFAAHWIAAALMLWLLYDLVTFFRRNNKDWSSYHGIFTWIASIGIILLLSVEMYQLILWTSYRDKTDWLWWQNLYYKAGLSILWGFCSFAMMWLGMKHRFRTLRIISLTLFTVTIVKLFLYDIRKIPPGGKIAAFILLGILLLVVSFMYQRLKKIIIENTTD